MCVCGGGGGGCMGICMCMGVWGGGGCMGVCMCVGCGGGGGGGGQRMKNRDSLARESHFNQLCGGFAGAELYRAVLYRA